MSVKTLIRALRLIASPPKDVPDSVSHVEVMRTAASRALELSGLSLKEPDDPDSDIKYLIVYVRSSAGEAFITEADPEKKVEELQLALKYACDRLQFYGHGEQAVNAWKMGGLPGAIESEHAYLGAGDEPYDAAKENKARETFEMFETELVGEIGAAVRRMNEKVWRVARSSTSEARKASERIDRAIDAFRKIRSRNILTFAEDAALADALCPIDEYTDFWQCEVCGTVKEKTAPEGMQVDGVWCGEGHHIRKVSKRLRESELRKLRQAGAPKETRTLAEPSLQHGDRVRFLKDQSWPLGQESVKEAKAGTAATVEKVLGDLVQLTVDGVGAGYTSLRSQVMKIDPSIGKRNLLRPVWLIRNKNTEPGAPDEFMHWVSNAHPGKLITEQEEAWLGYVEDSAPNEEDQNYIEQAERWFNSRFGETDDPSRDYDVSDIINMIRRNVCLAVVRMRKEQEKGQKDKLFSNPDWINNPSEKDLEIASTMLVIKAFKDKDQQSGVLHKTEAESLLFLYRDDLLREISSGEPLPKAVSRASKIARIERVLDAERKKDFGTKGWLSLFVYGSGKFECETDGQKLRARVEGGPWSYVSGAPWTLYQTPRQQVQADDAALARDAAVLVVHRIRRVMDHAQLKDRNQLSNAIMEILDATEIGTQE